MASDAMLEIAFEKVGTKKLWQHLQNYRKYKISKNYTLRKIIRRVFVNAQELEASTAAVIIAAATVVVEITIVTREQNKKELK